MQSIVEIKLSANGVRNVQKQCFQMSSVFKNTSAKKCSKLVDIYNSENYFNFYSTQNVNKS